MEYDLIKSALDILSEYKDAIIGAGSLFLAGWYVKLNAEKVKKEVIRMDQSIKSLKEIVDNLPISITNAVREIETKISTLNAAVAEVKTGVDANAEQLDGIQADAPEADDSPLESGGIALPHQGMKESWTAIRAQLLARSQNHANGNTRRKYGNIGRAYKTLARAMADDGWVSNQTAELVDGLQLKYRQTMAPTQRQSYDADQARQNAWNDAVTAFNTEMVAWPLDLEPPLRGGIPLPPR